MHSRGRSHFRLPIEHDGHLLDCLPLSFQAHVFSREHFVSEPHSPSHSWSIQGWISNPGNVKQGLSHCNLWSVIRWDMGSSCEPISPSGLGSRQCNLSVREEMERNYGLVSTDRGRERPGLPTLQINPEAQSCNLVLGSRWYTSHFFLINSPLCISQVQLVSVTYN